MAARDQRNFTVHMNMGSDDNKSSLRAARPAQKYFIEVIPQKIFSFFFSKIGAN